jgi:hypothetical protein
MDRTINRLADFFTSQLLLADQSLLITENARSDSDTLQSVGPLWTNDRPDAQTYLYLTTHNTEIP